MMNNKQMKNAKQYILILSILLATHIVSAQNWKPLAGPTGGNVTKLTMDANNNVYALVDGEVYKSANGGTTWNTLSGSINYLNGLEVIGSDVYINTWSDVYKSSNGGTSWTKINTTSGMGYLDIGMEFIPGVSGLLIYGTTGVWISVDSGVNWKKIYDKKTYRAAFSVAGDVYITVPEVGIVKHPAQTSLANWDQSKFVTIKPKLTTGNDEVGTIGVNRSNSDKLFISYQNAGQTALIYEVSTNGGSTWSTITSPTTGTPGGYWFTFAGKLYHIIGRNIYDVTDGANPSFTSKSSFGNPGFSNYNIKSFYYKNFNEIYVGVEGDGVWKSTDNGSIWAINNGTPTISTDSLSVSNAIMSSPARDIEFVGSRLMLVPHSDAWGYWTSTTKGNSWSWQSLPFYIRTYYPHKVFKRLQDNSIIVNSGSGTYRTTDGLTWSQLSAETFEDYVTVGTTDLYGFRANVIMKSTNGGTTWNAVTLSGYPTDMNHVQVAAYDGVNFYVAMIRNGQTEYWRIDATTFAATQLTVGLRTDQYTTAGLFIFKGKLYIGDNNKIAISNDQGNTFKYLNYDHSSLFPINQKVGGIGISKNGILVVTQDDGVTFTSTALPRDGFINNITSNDNGLTTYAAATSSPALKFAPSATDTLIYNKTQQYIDFGWQKMDGPTGGGTGKRLFKSSADQLFVDGNNSIYRFNATTKAWEFLEAAYVNANHAMFHDGTNIYQAQWNTLYKSTDGGNTFTKLSENQFTETITTGNGLFKTAAGTIFILSNNGLYRSTNDGVTFTKVKSGRSYTSIAESGTTLLSAGNDGGNMFVERSTDGGVTWTSAQAGVTFTEVKTERLLTSDGNNVFTLTTSNNIYKTIDGGVTWTSIKTSAIQETSLWGGSRVYVSPTGDYHFVAMGYPAKLYVSTDKGVTWTRKNTNTTGTKFNDIVDLMWVGARIYALSGWYEGILFSDDGGATFSVFENNKGFSGYSSWSGGAINIRNNIFNFGQDMAMSISKDAGATWTSSNIPANKILSLPNGDLIGYGNGRPYKSLDGGSTWSEVSAQYSWFPFLSYNGSDTSPNYIGIGGPTSCCAQNFYSSTDLINWSQITVTGLPSNLGGTGNGFSSLATLGNKIYITAYNPNSQLNEAYEINSGNATKLSLAFSHNQVISRDNKVYLFSSDGFIFETTDGVKWAKRAVPAGTDRLIFANNGYLFLSGNNGVLFVSRDGGVSWQNVSATNVKTTFGDIAIDLSTGIAYGTHPSRPLFKSAGIVVPNDKIGPTLQSFIPANGATGVKKSGLKLAIVFNEAPKAVTGKNLKIYKSTDPATPVETITVTNGVVFDNKMIFTPSFVPADLGVYYAVVDAGAFTDFYGNVSLAMGGSSVWGFTIEDATPPAIEFTTSNLEKGVTKTFEITVTDAGGIDNNSIKMFYRGITTASANTFSSAALTAGSGGKFTITASESWYDGMGLEFYFEAKDVSGNTVTSPAGAPAAGKYHYSYISYPSASNLKISSISFGEDASAYRIISVPYKLSDTKISTIFDELGSPNKKVWRMFSYAGNESWNEYGEAGLTDIQRGKGYWIIAKNNTDVFVEGAQTPENNRTSFFELPLSVGWNQIGNPYPVNISWTETIAGKTGIGSVKKYSNGTYTNADALNPYEGGFVFVTNAQNVKVRFPGITTGGRVGSKSSPDLASTNWELPIKVEQGAIVNELSGIGMNANADLNYDDFDDLNMPLFEGIQRANLDFEKKEGMVKKLSKDVVPTQSEFTWRFSLNTNGSERTSLTWNNDLFGENNKELFLMDEATQQLINMRLQSSYSFDPATSKSFKIYFGENLQSKIKPGKVLLGVTYPNPASDQVSIPFTLSDISASYSVKLEVYNNQGNRIAVLYEGQLKPGFYKQDWNVKDVVANGLYLVKMTASGTSIRETQIQKIIINR